MLAGRPLLAYTCEAARASKRLNRVILSTDDEAIARVARGCGVEVPFFRPSDASQDESPMLGVLQHALRWLEEHERYSVDVLVLLQPTSPLRRAEHIDAAVDLLLDSGADSVVSVVEVPHAFSPVSLMSLEERRLQMWMPGDLILRRQDKPKLFARNGPAVLAVRGSVILRQNSLYGNDIRPLVMDSHESIDIDGPKDMILAELLLNRRTVLGNFGSG